MSNTYTTTSRKPNIEKLARLIVRTGYADQIMKTLELGIHSGVLSNPESVKEGDKA